MCAFGWGKGAFHFLQGSTFLRVKDDRNAGVPCLERGRAHPQGRNELRPYALPGRKEARPQRYTHPAPPLSPLPGTKPLPNHSAAFPSICPRVLLEETDSNDT
jgi:hypothetical protein